MYSLFFEAKFWTLKDEIQIRETDFGAFRYYDKKELTGSIYEKGKQDYSEKHGVPYTLQNKRPIKLKDNLKELEQVLSTQKLIFHDWKCENVIQFVFTTGLIVNIWVDTHTGHLTRIVFDKLLVGKLLNESISDVAVTSSHIIITYTENQLTLVSFLKPKVKNSPPDKLNKLEPKVQHIELEGPSGRRLEHKITTNTSEDLVIIWWQASRNEIYPWSPLVKDKDRANILVYSLIGNKFELLCYLRTEHEPLSVCFSKLQSNVFLLIEQQVNRKGDVTVESSSYSIVKNSLQRQTATSIHMQTQICCHCFSPNEDKLVLGCIDSSVVIYDEDRGTTHLVKAAFIPNLISWHSDGSVFIIANEKSQFQCFDLALSCIKSQLMSEDVTPSNLIDLQSYFKNHPTLFNMKFNTKPTVKNYLNRYIPSNRLLLLLFEHGPICVLNMIGGGGLSHDVQNSGITPDVVIKQYLLWNQVDKAINMLLCMNWNTNGSQCLISLYHITNYIFKLNLTEEKEQHLETALGTFHVPLKPLTRATEIEFGDQVHDLTRRYFHHLIRYGLYEKAFRLAIDLDDYDLFVDLYHCALDINNLEMASGAKAKAEELINSSGSESLHSHCSRSSCSCSSYSDDSSSDDNLPPLPKINKIPPLPALTRGRLRESAFFNRNRNNIFTSDITTIPEEKIFDVDSSFVNVLDSQSPYFSSFSPNIAQIQSERNDNKLRNTDDWLNFNKDRKNYTNVIEKLYDLPASKFNQTDNTYKSSSLDNLDAIAEELDKLKLKPQYTSTPHILKTTILSSSFEPAVKIGSFDNLTTKYSSKSSPVYGLGLTQKNSFTSRPITKTTPNISPAKQKVKFSDTVTQIMVPDISKLTVDEKSTTKQKLRRSKNYHMPDPVQELADSLPLCLGNEDYLKNFSKSHDRHEDDDNHGTIKVIHFGVV